MSIITEALNGTSLDQKQIAQVGLGMVALMIQKNSDYGSSVFQVGTISPDVSAEQGIRVRLGDKLSRISNLISTPGNQQVAETLTDTFLDTAAYLLLLAIERLRTSGEIKNDREVDSSDGPENGPDV